MRAILPQPRTGAESGTVVTFDMYIVRRYSPMVSDRTRRAALSDVLALEKNLVVVSVAMFLLALGEQLWKRFLPKYLGRWCARARSACTT
jgi:hypothetical protein